MGKTYTVKLPDIGEGVAEGEVIEWLKNTGDSVAQDEPVVVVMTDKATVELPAPHPGVLGRQYFKPGDKAPVGNALYDIELANEIQQQEVNVKPEKQAAKKVARPCSAQTPSATTLALPKTRHLAHALGVDLTQISPSGHHGEITDEDVKQSFAKPNASALTHLPGDTVVPIIGIRNLMAKKMAESKQNIPHFSYFEQVDATRLVQLRLNVKTAAANEGINATYMPFLIRALSLTIEKYPVLNSSVDVRNNTIILHKQQNVGIAVSTPHGLIVPTLKNVQDMKLQDIIRSFDSLKKRALSNALQPQEMKDSTITVSNYGVLGGGGRWATPIINYPEVAILAVARIQKQPVVKNDQIVIRDTLNLSWSFDHRVIDGEMAAEASYYFATLIVNPAAIL